MVVGNSVLNDIIDRFHSKLHEAKVQNYGMGKFKSNKDRPKEAKQNSCC